MLLTHHPYIDLSKVVLGRQVISIKGSVGAVLSHENYLNIEDDEIIGLYFNIERVASGVTEENVNIQLLINEFELLPTGFRATFLNHTSFSRPYHFFRMPAKGSKVIINTSDWSNSTIIHFNFITAKYINHKPQQDINNKVLNSFEVFNLELPSNPNSTTLPFNFTNSEFSHITGLFFALKFGVIPIIPQFKGIDLKINSDRILSPDMNLRNFLQSSYMDFNKIIIPLDINVKELVIDGRFTFSNPFVHPDILYTVITGKKTAQ